MNSTRDKIFGMIREHGGARPHVLKSALGLSAVAIHKHLRTLTSAGLIEKRGTPPNVVYIARHRARSSTNIQDSLAPFAAELNRSFYYFTPTGNELIGDVAFSEFLTRTSQDKDPVARAREYLQIVEQAAKFRLTSGLIDGTQKLIDTFGSTSLNRLYYSDFYSLPKYGKTQLGAYLTHGKSGQNRELIKRIAEMTKTQIAGILSLHSIDSICFVPHSIPRKIPFLKEYRRLLSISLPEIQLLKGYSAGPPIAQKSLNKLSERIENARETIFLSKPKHDFRSTLIIDDALGSGATINEVGHKLIGAAIQPDQYTVYGYVVVGSYKGFEVISEI